MKKFIVVGIAALSLALTGCGAGNGYPPNGGYTSADWDMNNPSMYNNSTYCNGGTYNPLPNNQFSCFQNGTTTKPSTRPAPVVPPKTAQKAPVKPAAPVQKAPVQQAPKPAVKAPAPAPYRAPAPAPKTGK